MQHNVSNHRKVQQKYERSWSLNAEQRRRDVEGDDEADDEVEGAHAPPTPVTAELPMSYRLE